MGRNKRDLTDFNAIVGELLEFEQVKSLSLYSQHCNTSRLEHSLNVAYYSYITTKKLGLDYRSATRAAVLHDLFLYDWRTEKQPEGNHAFAHPVIALRTARTFTTVNKIEENAILSHMWPLSKKAPRSFEAAIVSVSDKLSTCIEIGKQLAISAKIRKSTKKPVYAR